MSQHTQSQSNCAWRNTTQSGALVEIYRDDGVGDIHGAIVSNVRGRRYLAAWHRDGKIKFVVCDSGVLQSVGSGESLIPLGPIIDWSKEEPWVKAIAMDSDGKWYRYEEVPTLEAGALNWNPQIPRNPQYCGFTQIHPDYVPKFDGNWKNSLVIRPN